MTLEEAWKKYLLASGESLPWEPAPSALRPAFEAGWHAHREALKQSDLFPGTLSSPVAQPVEHLSCKQDVAGATPVRDSTRTPGYWTTGGTFVANPDAIIKVRCDEITAEDIYAAYPRKVGKQAAIKAIEKAAKSMYSDKSAGWADNEPWQELLSATKRYAAATQSWPAADKQFIPHPATWFNRGSYDDDPKEWVRGAAAAPSQFTRKYE